MKYLSILSVLLLIGGNFSFAMEDGDNTQQSEITRIDWLKKNAKARAEKFCKKQEEQKNKECIGTFCDETNDMNRNKGKINITKGKTTLKKKRVCKEDEFCDSYDKKSTKSSLGEESSNNLPIFHNTGEFKGRSLRDGVIMSSSDDNNNIEDIKIEDLGENYYDNEGSYKHPKFKTIDEMENADIRSNFILDDDF